MNELIEKQDGSTKLMAVSSNIKSYCKIMNKLIDTYKLYEESVDTIVEVWKPMLNSSESLKKTFNLLIMTEFDENIWQDRNIKIVIEEIMQHPECMPKHKKKLDEIIKINESLEKIKKSYNKQDSTTPKQVKKQNFTEIENEISSQNSNICACPKCSKPQLPKKKKVKPRVEHPHAKPSKKEKTVMVNGKHINDLEDEELINYINGGSNPNKPNGSQLKTKAKPEKKKVKGAKSEAKPVLSETIRDCSVLSNNSISLSDTTTTSSTMCEVPAETELDKDMNETDFNDLKKRFSYDHDQSCRETKSRLATRPKLKPNYTKEWIGIHLILGYIL